VCLSIVSLFSASGRVFANPWSMQPLIGVAAEYASNPELIASSPQSETHAALLVDLPLNYDLDSVHFAVTPRVRYSNTTGYSSITSNFYHLDSSAQFMNDLSSLTFTGSFYRDSSLLYAGGLSNGVGERRDTSTADINWQRILTERVQFQFDVNTARTLYGQNTALTGLVDYRYSSASPSFAYMINERDTFRVIGAVGRYYSLNGSTSSDSVNLQLGYDHRLNEVWKLSATAGYSKSTNEYNYNSYEFYDGFIFPVFETLKSRQYGGVYSMSLTRQGEVLGASAGVSRALTPTGLAFLTRQDTVNGSVSYNYSERWTFTANAIWQNLSNPVIGGGSIDRRFYDIDFSAQWHWTEQWSVTLGSRILGQRYDQPAVSAASNGLSLEISRQFYRTNN
jgi:hypothetical protein